MSGKDDWAWWHTPITRSVYCTNCVASLEKCEKLLRAIKEHLKHGHIKEAGELVDKSIASIKEVNK